MVAVGLATLIVGDATIYRSQLKTRAESAAHRIRFALPLLSLTRAGEVMVPPRLVVDSELTVAEAREELARSRLPGAPVVQGENVCGRVTPRSLAHLPAEDQVGRHAEHTDRAAHSAETLDIVAERLTTTGSSRYRSWTKVRWSESSA
jgi:CIC family chloride channel protein